jgi:hypothetical protein
MRRLLAGSIVACALAMTDAPVALAQCDDVDSVRAVVYADCPCTDTKRKRYQKCVAASLKDQGIDRACRRQIKRIVNASVCGQRESAVICCRARGSKTGSVKRKPTQCREATGAVACEATRTPIGGRFFNSVADVCTDAGACRPFPTTTTTITTATTTSSTNVLPLPTTTSLLGTTTTTATVPATTTTSTEPTGTTTTTSLESTTTTEVPSSTTSTLEVPGTTTTTLPSNPCALTVPSLEFTTAAPVGSCGEFLDEEGNVLGTLGCGGLNIGGGNGTVLEGPTPDGASNRFLADCTGDVCTLTATTAPTECWDCTSAGCNFGTPLPIVNGALSTCVLNTFASAATGSIDLATGVTNDLSINLASQVFLSGLGRYQTDGGPCPVCSAAVGGPAIAGTPGTPATGVCDGGPDAGQPCRTTNSAGLSRDCLPGGADASNPCDPAVNGSCADGTANLGALPVDLTPLTTGALEDTADAAGDFCPGQRTAGCFGRANPSVGQRCRTIRTGGAPAGPIAPNTPTPVTLASIFCIPDTTNAVINLSADIAGPGQTSLPGTFTLHVP